MAINSFFLVVIILMAIVAILLLAMAIGGYSINGYL